MIAPYNELILRHKKDVWIIHHPIDLRDKLKYKRILEPFFRDASRSECDYLKIRSTTLIHYED